MIHDIPNIVWVIIILCSATCFTLFWFFDSLTHQKIAETDITDQELQVHRNILIVSLLMELSFVFAYWFGYAILPLFIAVFITRTMYEFIDELKFHTSRCTSKESLLHLGMWISVLSKTTGLFIWSFILKYDGLFELPIVVYVWGILIIGIMTYISFKEWRL